MKKFFILSTCLFVVYCLVGQKIPFKKPAVQTSVKEDFCSVMQKLVTHSNTNFKELKTAKKIKINDEHGKYIDDGESSKVKFPGAKASFISPLTGYPDMFRAVFGTYQKSEVAKKKADSIGMLLKSCMKDYDLDLTQSSTLDNPFELFFRGKKTDSLQPHDMYLQVSRRVPANLSADDYYLLEFTMHGRKNVEVPKIEKKYVLINPSMQEQYLPNGLQDLYLGISVDELKKRHPAVAETENSLKDLVEKFSAGDIEEIIYQREFDVPVIYELIIKYRSEQMAINVARQLYEKSKTATKKTEWDITLKDGLPLKCWIVDRKVCIMKLAYTKLNNQ